MTKRNPIALFLLCLLGIGILPIHHVSAQDCGVKLNIMTPSSLYEALDALDKQALCKQGLSLRLITGSSATLARQIENGFEADVFISANAQWMEHLSKNQHIVEASRGVLLGNSLVKVTTKRMGASNKWTTGDPAYVPLGIYAKEALLHSGEWQSLERTLIPAMNARSALAILESGAVDMAILYKSDTAHLSKGYKITPIDERLHSPIRYEIALINTSGHEKSARAIIDHLRSSPILDHFKAFGFSQVSP